MAKPGYHTWTKKDEFWAVIKEKRKAYDSYFRYTFIFVINIRNKTNRNAPTTIQEIKDWCEENLQGSFKFEAHYVLTTSSAPGVIGWKGLYKISCSREDDIIFAKLRWAGN